MRKRQWLAGAVAVVLVGCGGSSADQESRATPEPTVEPRSAEQLVAALPEDGDLPDGARDIRRCPPEDCFGTGEWTGVVFAAPQPEGLDGPELERWESSQAPGSEWVHLRVLGAADEEEVADHVDLTREQLAELVGEYDVDFEETEQGFTPGMRGVGRLTESSVRGWTALEHSARSDIIDQAGEVDGSRGDATLLLWSGTMVVEARAYLSGAYQDSVAEDVVRDLIEQYLDRLESS